MLLLPAGRVQSIQEAEVVAPLKGVGVHGLKALLDISTKEN